MEILATSWPNQEAEEKQKLFRSEDSGAWVRSEGREAAEGRVFPSVRDDAFSGWRSEG